MLKSERKQFILEKVLKEKFVSLETLVQELGTIWEHLNRLFVGIWMS